MTKTVSYLISSYFFKKLPRPTSYKTKQKFNSRTLRKNLRKHVKQN